MQNGKAVVGSSGSLFEEVKSDGSVILILSGKKKAALCVKDTFADTPITVTTTFNDDSSNHKWIINPHNATSL